MTMHHLAGAGDHINNNMNKFITQHPTTGSYL